jgi:hypothetical protein
MNRNKEMLEKKKNIFSLRLIEPVNSSGKI